MKYSKQTGGFYLVGFHADIPADAVSITLEEHAALMAGQDAGGIICGGDDGRPVLVAIPEPSLEQRTATLLAKVDAHLNAAAKAKGYDSILSASLRAAYSGPFHAEGMAFATWMDATYAACYALLAQFTAGEIAEPTAEQLLAMLPVLQLPTN